MSKVKNTKPKVIEDSEESSESQLPLIASKPSKKTQVEEKKVAKKVVKQESSEEEETPVVQKKPTKQIKTETGPIRKGSADKKKVVAKVSSSEEESEEEKPKKVVKVKSPVQKAVVPKKKVVQESEEESEEEEAPKPTKKSVKSPVQKAIVQKKKVPEPESSSEQEEEKLVKKVVAVKSPVQKAQAKITKKVESSEQQEEEAPKPVKKVATKPAVIQKKKVSSSEEEQEEEKPKPKKAVAVVKSPVQKPLAAKKKPEPVEEEEEEEVKPKARKVSKDITKMVDEDEEGEFEVCVQGLSYNAYDSDIKKFFEGCGNISNVKLLTKPDGSSKGTAFVKFSKKSSFNSAVALAGSEHMGRTLKIEQSQAKKQSNGFNKGGNTNGGFNKGGNFGKPEGEAVIESPTLFIGGLSYNSTADSIKEFFASVGPVNSARVVTDRETQKPRGFGYVEFFDLDTAKKAYKELNGGYLDGRSIRLDAASQRDRPQGGSFGGNQGGYGGQGGYGANRNPGNSTVVLSQDDKNAKKGAIGTFQGKKVTF